MHKNEGFVFFGSDKTTRLVDSLSFLKFDYSEMFKAPISQMLVLKKFCPELKCPEYEMKIVWTETYLFIILHFNHSDKFP